MGERSHVVTAPCSGDAFNFEVTLTFFWYGHRGQKLIPGALDLADTEQRRLIERRIRELSRHFGHDQIADLEQRVNTEFKQPFLHQDKAMTSYLSLRVAPEEKLRQHLQEQTINYSRIQEEHVRAKQHIMQLNELQQLWTNLLRNTQEDAVHALQLAADPSKVGDVAREVMEDKKQTWERLNSIYEKAAADHEKLDLYDFVAESDTALRELMEYIKVNGDGAQPGKSKPAG